MKRILLLLFFLTAALGFAQVGVNTTTPDPSSMLDISATNKGVLVPRVSLANVTTTMLDGTNTAATGLLIWNTNAATVGGNGVGFYYFNGTQWIPITQSGAADNDWYEIGTTTAPNAITDDMFHTGNVVVGKNTIGFDNPKLSVEESGSGTPSPLKIVNIKDSSTSTSAHNGLFLEMAATTTANEYGITVQHDNPNSPLKYGVHSVVNNGSGTNSSFQGRVSGTGLNTGASILISDSGSPSNGVQGGFEALFQQPTTSFTRGLYNQFGTNNLALDGGPKYGVYNSFGSPARNVGGELYGSYNAFDANLTSFYNKYGSFTLIPSTVGGIHYGIYAEVPKSNSYAGYFLGRVSIGTTTANNYILPSSRGTNGQTMQTDGSGNVSWVNPVVDTDDQTTDVFSLTGSTLNLSLQNDGVATQTVDLSPLKDHDFYEVGGTTAPDAITDDKYTQGTLTIGANTAATGVLDVDNATKATSVDINNTFATNPTGIDVNLTSNAAGKTGIKTQFNGTAATGTNSFIQNTDNMIGNTSRTAINNDFSGTSSSISTSITGLKNDFKSTSNYYAILYGVSNSFASTTNAWGYGMLNSFTNGGSTPSYGVVNGFNGTSTGTATGISNSSNNYNGSVTGVDNSFTGTGNGIHYGVNNFLNGTGTGDKYGVYNFIATTAGGNHYGLYSNVLKPGSFAGYFQGAVSIGTSTINNYILPPSRGTNGQTMQTDGSGNVSWVNPVVDTDTDDQGTDVFSLTGNTLNLSLQNDGVATQTVDLSPLKDHDWYEVGGTSQPNAITDNIYKQGTVTIGTNTAATGVLDIDNASKTTSLDINNTFAANPVGVNIDINTTSANKTGIAITQNGTFTGYGGVGSMIQTLDNCSGNYNRFAMYNVFNGVSTDTNIATYGIRNAFGANSFVGDFVGIANYDYSTSNGDRYGIVNSSGASGNGINYGVYNYYTGTGTGNKYGVYNLFPTTTGGTHYGIYSSVLKTGSYAGYFLGNVSIGTTALNNYTLPASRGTNGQTMQTDGSGNVTWVNPITDTDDQTTDVFSLTGNTLNLSLQNDGVATQTVDLSSLKDADWYEVGGTTPADAITDNIYTSGDVSIGKVTAASAKLDVDAGSKLTTTSFTNNNTTAGVKFGILNNVTVDTNTTTSYGISNTISGNSGFKYGISNRLYGAVSGVAAEYSMLNVHYTSGSVNGYGVFNAFNPAATNSGLYTGVYNEDIGSNHNGAFTGVENNASNTTANPMTGISNTFSGVGTGIRTGVNNNISGGQLGNSYGVNNTITSTGGTKYGVYSNLNAPGIKYGVYNDLISSAGGSAISYGVYNKVNNTGGTIGSHFGVYNEMLAFDNQYGNYTTMQSVSNYPQYGNYVTIAGGGTGNRYGFYSTINASAGGTHYGVYSDATKAGSYAGYFLGNVSIGTTIGNNYILPPSRGTNGQIMQTDGSGNVSWTTPSNGSSLDDAYDFGGAGSGRNIIADSGAVTISGTDGLVSTGIHGSGAVASTGAGTRMVWNPRKSAFRAGFVSSTQWNDANIGQYSFAAGSDNIASGAYTVAFGSGSTATGLTATAFGSSMSTGIASTSFGSGNASGGFATAFGTSTASGSHATAFGTSIASANYATAYGNSTASGISATSFGSSSATGDYATAMGTTSTANGNNSFAFGNSSQSIGIGSFAGGFSSITNNNYSSAIGLQCITNGDDSFAAGSKSVTYAKAATAFGRENNAQSFGETVLGVGATNYTPSVGGTIYFRAGNVTDRLFVIGNALDANNNNIVDAAERSDALIMLKNGETGLGMNPVTGSRLAVSGKTQTTNFQMTSGAFGGYILQSDATGNATWVNPTTLSPAQWKIGGNSGTIAGTDYIGTNDPQDFDFRTNGVLKLRLTQQGQLSIQNTGGSVFVGAGAGNADDLTNNLNTFVGTNAGALTNSGNLNTAFGHFALDTNTTGLGNTAIGKGSLTTNDLGNNNTGLGRLADVSTGSLSNASVIGFNATVNASNKVRLGNTAVTVVEGQVPYTNPSDARFKFNVKEDVPGLDFIKKLKPVTYNFDTKKFDEHLNRNRNKSEVADEDFSKSTAIVRTGFLAQDVEKICNDLGYNFDGLHIPDANNPTDNYGIAYSQFIMPIVKAVQEQQVIIENQKTELEQLKSELEKYKSLEDRIKALEQK